MNVCPQLAPANLLVTIFFLWITIPCLNLCAETDTNASHFEIIEAEDGKACAYEGRVDPHVYPRSVGRRMAMLHPGSRLTTSTQRRNISLILPPMFESPGPRYGNFLASRFRVRVDELPWRELTLATARTETVLAENLLPGKHTIVVEPLEGVAVVDAFRCSDQPMTGITGHVVAQDYSELLTDVRFDLFRGDQKVRSDYARDPRSGAFGLLCISPGIYRLHVRAAGWLDETKEEIKLAATGSVDLGVINLKRDPRCGGADGQDRPGPQFGYSISTTPGSSFSALVNLPSDHIERAVLRSPFRNVPVTVLESKKLPLGRWNDTGKVTFQIPENTPWDMYDLVLTFNNKAIRSERIWGQAVCVRPQLPANYFVAGCGHMNTWGQQTAEYLARVAKIAELAGARTLLIANEVNAAYISGALTDLRIPYVVSSGNHTMPRWTDFFGSGSRAHDDGPMRIVEFGRRPYEAWDEVYSLFKNRPTATNRVILCYEGFAPIDLIREQNIKLLFDAHSDNAHADRDLFPESTFHMRAPTQETLRWIPMTHDGVSSIAKANADIPVLPIPRTGLAPLRTDFESKNDGSANEQRLSLINEFKTPFPQARVRMVLRRGKYQATTATIVQAFESDDGTRTILDLETEVPATSTVVLHVKEK